MARTEVLRPEGEFPVLARTLNDRVVQALTEIENAGQDLVDRLEAVAEKRKRAIAMLQELERAETDRLREWGLTDE